MEKKTEEEEEEETQHARDEVLRVSMGGASGWPQCAPEPQRTAPADGQRLARAAHQRWTGPTVLSRLDEGHQGVGTFSSFSFFLLLICPLLLFFVLSSSTVFLVCYSFVFFFFLLYVLLLLLFFLLLFLLIVCTILLLAFRVIDFVFLCSSVSLIAMRSFSGRSAIVSLLHVNIFAYLFFLLDAMHCLCFLSFCSLFIVIVITFLSNVIFLVWYEQSRGRRIVNDELKSARSRNKEW